MTSRVVDSHPTNLGSLHCVAIAYPFMFRQNCAARWRCGHNQSSWYPLHGHAVALYFVSRCRYCLTAVIPEDGSAAPAADTEMNAYLDIETTGLSPSLDAITVVGIYRDEGNTPTVRQLVGSQITRLDVTELLRGVRCLYTYNGARFDLVFLRSQLNIELDVSTRHEDLMYTCWNRGLYGGLKAVERCLGIKREILDISGREAVALWWRYVRNQDNAALKRLLQYNAEDVLNLKVLRDRLHTG